MAHPDTLRKRIFDYMDYREFLRDLFQQRSGESKTFSLRFFSQRIGVNSGSLSRILKGQRHLDPDKARDLARILGLKEQEAEYLTTLVLFGQAKNTHEQNLCMEKMLRLRGAKVKTVEKRQYEYFRKWYYVATRELLNFFPFDGNYPKLARMLRPPISVSESKEAVKLLLDLGLVEKDGAGNYRLTEQAISSGESIRSLFLNNLHYAMSEKASKALFDMEPRERDFSGVTLTLSPEGFQAVKDMLRIFRKDIQERARKDRNVNGVFRINFQFFPLSRQYKPGSP